MTKEPTPGQCIPATWGSPCQAWSCSLGVAHGCPGTYLGPREIIECFRPKPSRSWSSLLPLTFLHCLCRAVYEPSTPPCLLALHIDPGNREGPQKTALIQRYHLRSAFKKRVSRMCSLQPQTPAPHSTFIIHIPLLYSLQ